MSPGDFLFPPEGGQEGDYDHVSIGPDVGMTRSFEAIKDLVQLVGLDSTVLPGADSYLSSKRRPTAMPMGRGV